MDSAITCRKMLTDLDKLINFSDAFAEKYFLNGDLRKTIAVVIEEYFTNFVKYHEPSSSIFVAKLELIDGQVIVELNIDGDYFNPIDYYEAAINKSNLLGLRVISNLSKHLSHAYVDSVNIVIASISIN